MKSYRMAWGHHRLDLGKRTCIMGVLNVTPDSFSDGGLFFDADAAIRQARKMADAGADILDIGGESTRPFSEPVSEAEECRRVLPVIETLAGEVNVPISIDTTKASVARRALKAGASIINDISALGMDPTIADVAASADVPMILMHMKGTPKTMQVDPVYDDLIGEVTTYFEERIARAERAGVQRGRIILDPGIGFGKTLTHNLILLKRLTAFAHLDCPMLVGTSRKSFIRKLIAAENQKDIDPLDLDVEKGTQATVAAAILGGAHIVRVHDVANTRITARVTDAVRNASATN